MSSEFTDSPTLSSFGDEFFKIALSTGDEVTPDDFQSARKSRVRRVIGDAVLGAAGFGVGYGLGNAAGRLTVAGKPTWFRNKYAPYVLGAAGLGLGLAQRAANRKRQEYIDQPINTPRTS